ncbi:MAG: CapA family protein [Firmicutes bacterium]|nr:CapA family protein [Bacillota bacterium]
MRRSLAIFVSLLMVALAGAALAEFIFADSSYTPGEARLPAETPPEAEQYSERVEISISAAGDVTLGGNMRGNPRSNMYTRALEEKGGDLSYFFANVLSIFGQDDLTIVNFEGTLTNATDHKNNEYCFRAPPEHVKILPLGSIEAVAFENNHVMDFRQQGYEDTLRAFESEGIVYAADGHLGVYETKGVKIGMLAYQTFGDAYERLHEQVPRDIAAARAQGCMIVVVSYHWGEERDYAPHDRQQALGRATIDAGADLVLGHHSHRHNPIELYNGRYIVYSLGNFSFSGNTGPRDMDTFIFQQKFVVTPSAVMPGAFRIIPCSISSVTAERDLKTGVNDLAPTPFAPGGAGSQRVISAMLANGKKLPYAVGAYPTEWEPY